MLDPFMKLVLASQSIDRKKCFQRAGIDVMQIPSHFDEDSIILADPLKKIAQIAFEKARIVKKIWLDQFFSTYGDALIIAADTVGIFRGKLFGKPASRQKASIMLKTLSGNTHSVYTALNLQSTNTSQIESDIVQTNVHFQTLTDSEIQAYLSSTDEYNSRAAAYSIIDRGSLFIDRIEGSFSNVIGLPMAQLRTLLTRFDIELFKE